MAIRREHGMAFVLIGRVEKRLRFAGTHSGGIEFEWDCPDMIFRAVVVLFHKCQASQSVINGKRELPILLTWQKGLWCVSTVAAHPVHTAVSRHDIPAVGCPYGAGVVPIKCQPPFPAVFEIVCHD